MKFDLLAIFIMLIAVVVGQVAGGLVESWIGGGLTGIIATLFSILAVGLITFAVYVLATGGKFDLILGLIFAFIVYVANLISGYVAGAIGFGGGLLTLVMTAIVASALWGWVGGKAGGTKAVKAGIQP